MGGNNDNAIDKSNIWSQWVFLFLFIQGQWVLV